VKDALITWDVAGGATTIRIGQLASGISLFGIPKIFGVPIFW